MKEIIGNLQGLSSSDKEERMRSIVNLGENLKRHYIARLAIAYVALYDSNSEVRSKARSFLHSSPELRVLERTRKSNASNSAISTLTSFAVL